MNDAKQQTPMRSKLVSVGVTAAAMVVIVTADLPAIPYGFALIASVLLALVPITMEKGFLVVRVLVVVMVSVIMATEFHQAYESRFPYLSEGKNPSLSRGSVCGVLFFTTQIFFGLFRQIFLLRGK